MDSKALARQIYEAKTQDEKRAAQVRLEKHIKQRQKQGMDPKQVMAAIKAWITRLAQWDQGKKKK
jgi:hypothetical protein